MEKEPSVFLRKDGRYSSTVTRNGKRKCFYGATEDEVREKIRVFVNENADICRRKEERTLEKAMRVWLESDMRIFLKPKSYETKVFTVERFIVPALGDRAVDSIVRTDIQKLIADLSRTYAWWTVKKVYDALRLYYSSDNGIAAGDYV